MEDSNYSLKSLLIFSATLIVFIFLMVRLNLFQRDYIYSGTVQDALGMGAVDLVELRAEGKMTYTDKNGRFSLLVKQPLFWSLTKNNQDKSIDVIPPFDFEGSGFKIPCTLVASGFISIRTDCSALIYPTAQTVASRVLSTEISQGLFSAARIATRKSSLWDFLSEESKKQWVSREEFIKTLVSQETDRSKLKLQTLSFVVSREAKFLTEYKYLDRFKITGDIAAVDASVANALGKVANITLYFVKKDKIWRYLMPEKYENWY